MKNMPHIASRMLNPALLLESSYARTFFSALGAGKMRGIRLGRVWRVTESNLKTFIEDHRPK
ncbi:MAG: hypothetical protein V7731_08510 [Amphritea sp.]